MHPLFGPFERIYVINLSSRIDRLRSIGGQLGRIGLSFDGDRVVRFSGIVPERAEGFPSIGARGCFLSHLGVLEAAEADNLENVVVIEDDLGFVPNFEERIEQTMGHLKTVSWDMLYLGHTASRVLPEPLSVQDAAIGLLCLHFYAVTRTLRRALIPFLHELSTREAGSPLGGPMHVDGAYSLFREQHPEFTTCLVNPPLGYQLSSRSNITPRWFDQFALLRGPLSWVRDLRSAIGGRVALR